MPEREPTLGGLGLPHFLVKQLKPERHGITEADLATSVQEIEIQTQILGASFLKVHIADPEWKVINSGLVKVDEDGFLNELEVEFPEATKYFWRLVAIEGNRDFTQAGLIMTFEDRVVARLRKRWGHLTAAAGTTTRAQFVRQLVNECNLKERGKFPPIKFVSPGINRIEPIEESLEEKEAKTGITKTTKAKLHASEKARKEVGPVTRQTWAESVLELAGWQQSINNVKALIGWATQEGGAGPQFGVANNSANYNPLNTTREEPGATNTGVQGNIKSYVSWAQGVEATVATLKNGLYGNIVRAFEAGNNAGAVAQAIVQSEWGTKEPVASVIASAQLEGPTGTGAMIMGTRIPVKSTNARESDVGQLSRGTTQNPDENSFQCMERLAQQVNWRLFTDGRNTLFYMDGPDLIHQRPVLYINPVHKLSNGDITDHIIREDKGRQRIDEYGQIVQPFSFTYDNVTLEYRATHKIKGRTQRKAAIAKPASPAEIRLLLNCGMTEYRAGDVFVFRHCGPIGENQGRWIVQDATREAMRYPYTKFILVPAPEPLPEPKATGTGESNVVNPSSSPLGGAATNPAPGASWSRLDMGFDGNYGEAGPVAPYNGTVKIPGIGGWPGEGTYFYIVNDDQTGPDYTRAMYFAEGATPTVKDGTHVTAGSKLGTRVYHGGTGGLGNFEIGPAQVGNGDTLAKSYGLGTEGAKKMVLSFASWLQSLGASPPTDTKSAGNT